MQIKFCDDICAVHQGPILGPILSNTSINGIEHSLSKLADDTTMSSAVGITEGRDGSEGQWEAAGMCSWEHSRARSCTKAGGNVQYQNRLGVNERVHWEQHCRKGVGDTGRWKIRYYFLTKVTVIISSCNRMSKLSVNTIISRGYSGKCPTFPSVLYSCKVMQMYGREGHESSNLKR